MPATPLKTLALGQLLVGGKSFQKSAAVGADGLEQRSILTNTDICYAAVGFCWQKLRDVQQTVRAQGRRVYN